MGQEGEQDGSEEQAEGQIAEALGTAEPWRSGEWSGHGEWFGMPTR